MVFDLLADGVEEAGDRHRVDLAVQVAEGGEEGVFGVKVGGEACDEGFDFFLVGCACLFGALGDEDGCYQGQIGAREVGEGDGWEGAGTARAFLLAFGADGAGIAVTSGGGVGSDGRWCARTACSARA